MIQCGSWTSSLPMLTSDQHDSTSNTSNIRPQDSTFELNIQHENPTSKPNPQSSVQFFESNDIHIAGLIVAEYSAHHSHWNAETSLGEWLKSRGIPALHGVDTRMLTKKVRHGTQIFLTEVALPEIALAALVFPIRMYA